jgi:hypothetical protein
LSFVLESFLGEEESNTGIAPIASWLLQSDSRMALTTFLE